MASVASSCCTASVAALAAVITDAVPEAGAVGQIPVGSGEAQRPVIVARPCLARECPDHTHSRQCQYRRFRSHRHDVVPRLFPLSMHCGSVTVMTDWFRDVKLARRASSATKITSTPAHRDINSYPAEVYGNAKPSARSEHPPTRRRIAFGRYKVLMLDMKLLGRNALPPTRWAKAAFVVKDLLPAVDTTPNAVVLMECS